MTALSLASTHILPKTGIREFGDPPRFSELHRGCLGYRKNTQTVGTSTTYMRLNIFQRAWAGLFTIVTLNLMGCACSYRVAYYIFRVGIKECLPCLFTLAFWLWAPNWERGHRTQWWRARIAYQRFHIQSPASPFKVSPGAGDVRDFVLSSQRAAVSQTRVKSLARSKEAS